FVVVDTGDEQVQMAKDEGWLVIQGDATEEVVLQEAGIGSAAALVTALDTDAQNLFVTVTARSLNPDMFIVARSSHVSSEDKLVKGGANRVLPPNVIGGRRMAMMALNPPISDYLDLVAHGSGVEYRLQEVELRPGSPYDESTIAEARVRELTGAYILAVRHRDGRIDHNPAPDSVLHVGDRLVVLGTESQVSALSARART
ncbi:MAG: TrkA family potassium uptake protein, partial [Actinobacteria bacterium]